MYKPAKRFFRNEVFEVPNYNGHAPISSIRGFCLVLHLSEYVTGKARGYSTEDIFISEQSYYFYLRKS